MAKGDHIFTNRAHFGLIQFEHHGIDCGNGSVIHYDGNVICRVSYREFSQGGNVHVKQYPLSSDCFTPDLTIALAESFLGENLYHLLHNNCEHFATWCKTRKWESEQVSSWIPWHDESLIKGLREKQQQLAIAHREAQIARREAQLRVDQFEALEKRKQIDAALKTDHADYQPLRDELEQGHWRNADELTRKLMLDAAGMKHTKYFNAKDITQFPQKDLLIIDKLWGSHSQNRFGFSIQKTIYETLGGNASFCDEIYEKFCIHAGWNKPMQFNLQAPKGHLPFGDRNRWEIVEFFVHLTTNN